MNKHGINKVPPGRVCNWPHTDAKRACVYSDQAKSCSLLFFLQNPTLNELMSFSLPLKSIYLVHVVLAVLFLWDPAQAIVC